MPTTSLTTASMTTTGTSLLLVLVDGHYITAEQRQLALARHVALQSVEFLAEVVDVLERAVHRGEANVGDVIELAQFGHHEFTDAARCDLALGGHAQLVDHRAHRGFDLFLGHRPLLQRAIEADAQLARVELLAAAIALDDHRQLQLDRFQGAETLAAGLAFTPPADRRAVVGYARIDHAGVLVLAEGAMHALGGF